MTMTRRRVRCATSFLFATIVLTTGACGEEPAPDTAVPRLEMTLSRVDDSLANRNYEAARTALQALIAQTQTALEDGTLGQAQADRIQAAAARLLSELPDPPARSPSPPPPSEDLETTPNGTDDSHDEEEDGDEDKDKDKDKDEDKDTDEDKDKDKDEDED